MKQATLVLAIMIMVLCSAAQADVLFNLGNNPQPDEENILLNKNTTGLTVYGQTQSGILVAFSSTTDTLTEPSSGQARIEAQDEWVNNITISVPGGTFGDLIMNPFNINCPPGVKCDDEATVTAIGTSTHPFNYILGNGNNFLTITTSDGEMLASVSIDYSRGFESLQQPRISGVAGGVPVPEPATMLLLGSGLLGLAGYGRKKFCKR